MFQLLIVCLVILFLMIYLNKRIGKITTILPKMEEEDLIELPDERAYYDETNKVIIDLKKKIDKTGIREEDIEEIKLLKKQISDNFKSWGEIQTTLTEMIEERTSFVTQGNFYPKEYVYDINRMRTEKEKARDYQLNNPLKPLNKVQDFIKEQNDKVELYKEIKGKVEVMLEKLEIYEKGLKTKKEKVPYFKKKQDLYLHLHNGNLSEARKLMKEFKGKIKNIK